MNTHVKPSKDAPVSSKRLWVSAALAGMVLMIVSAALVPLPRKQTAQAAPLAPRRGRITAYVQDRAGLQLRDADAPHLDQLNYAFALIEDGKATGSHWRSVDKVTRYLKRHPHIQGVMSVGGWGAEGFSDAVATADGRARLADSMLALMDQHGFTGVDLDWEYPGSAAGGLKHRPEDWDNYLSLMALLRKGLDERSAATGRKHVLSVALGASESLIQAVDGKRLSALVDQVNVMTYDLTGFDRMTGHHAALYPDGERKLGGAYAIQAYAKRGIPMSKMQLGAAFYGRAWRQVPDANHGLGQRAGTSGNKVLSYDEIAQRLADGKTERHFDENAQSPWLYDGSTFVSYEDAASLAAKASYVREHGLLGISCWELGQDRTGELLKALHEGLS